jgi:hypothetical protein
MGRRGALVGTLLVLLAGCGERLDAADRVDRTAALHACSDRSIIAALATDPDELLAGMRRLEACMALRNLPGHATYDPSKKSVLFAYEPERPSLRF